jgi:hypothetical protein
MFVLGNNPNPAKWAEVLAHQDQQQTTETRYVGLINKEAQ